MHCKSSFRDMAEAGKIVTYLQFWPGKHVPILLNLPQPHYIIHHLLLEKFKTTN